MADMTEKLLTGVYGISTNKTIFWIILNLQWNVHMNMYTCTLFDVYLGSDKHIFERKIVIIPYLLV